MFEEFAPRFDLATGDGASSGQSRPGEVEDGMTVNFLLEVALSSSSDLLSQAAIAGALALGIDFVRQRIRKSD